MTVNSRDAASCKTGDMLRQVAGHVLCRTAGTVRAMPVNGRDAAGCEPGNVLGQAANRGFATYSSLVMRRYRAPNRELDERRTIGHDGDGNGTPVGESNMIFR